MAGIKNLRFHDLRHTYGTYLRMKGADLLTLCELMGHQDIRTTMRYAHASREHKRQAASYLTFVYPRVRTRSRGRYEGEKAKNNSNQQELAVTKKSEIDR